MVRRAMVGRTPAGKSDVNRYVASHDLHLLVLGVFPKPVLQRKTPGYPCRMLQCKQKAPQKWYQRPVGSCVRGFVQIRPLVLKPIIAGPGHDQGAPSRRGNCRKASKRCNEGPGVTDLPLPCPGPVSAQCRSSSQGMHCAWVE
jgi:hypothetical protein